MSQRPTDRDLTMKTDVQKLAALIDYLALNQQMAYHRLWAETYFQAGDEVASWRFLFTWAYAKDERSKLWKTFQQHYPDAIMLKEGV